MGGIEAEGLIDAPRHVIVAVDEQSRHRPALENPLRDPCGAGSTQSSTPCSGDRVDPFDVSSEGAERGHVDLEHQATLLAKNEVSTLGEPFGDAGSKEHRVSASRIVPGLLDGHGRRRGDHCVHVLWAGHLELEAGKSAFGSKTRAADGVSDLVSDDAGLDPSPYEPNPQLIRGPGGADDDPSPGTDPMGQLVDAAFVTKKGHDDSEIRNEGQTGLVALQEQRSRPGPGVEASSVNPSGDLQRLGGKPGASGESASSVTASRPQKHAAYSRNTYRKGQPGPWCFRKRCVRVFAVFAAGSLFIGTSPEAWAGDLSDALGFAREVMGDAAIEGYEDFVDDDPSEALSILLSRDRPGEGARFPGSSRRPSRPFDRLGRSRLSYAEVAPHVQEAVLATGLPAALIDAVIRTESGYRPHAVSPVGARGLMQLMPGTAREVGAADAFDPRQNILGGARYLRKMYDRFGSLELAIAAYNAGPAKVARHRGVPPIQETRRYVAVVMDRYRKSPLR